MLEAEAEVHPASRLMYKHFIRRKSVMPVICSRYQSCHVLPLLQARPFTRIFAKTHAPEVVPLVVHTLQPLGSDTLHTYSAVAAVQHHCHTVHCGCFAVRSIPGSAEACTLAVDCCCCCSMAARFGSMVVADYCIELARVLEAFVLVPIRYLCKADNPSFFVGGL